MKNEQGLRIGALRSTSDSARVYCGTCIWWPGKVAIKHYADPYLGSSQHAALEKYHRAVCSKRWSVPLPIKLLQDGSISVTEWVDAPSMQELNQQGLFRYWTLARDLERAGQWLHHFHHIGNVYAGHLDVEKRLIHLDDVFDSRSLPRSITEAARLLHDTASIAARVEVKQSSTVHGDFKASNVLIGPERVIGIDFGWEYTTSVVADVAHFVNHIHMLRLRYGDPRSANQLTSFFLRGYGPVPDLPYCWLRIHDLLRMWAMKPRSLLANSVFAYVLRNMKRDLYRGLESS